MSRLGEYLLNFMYTAKPLVLGKEFHILIKNLTLFDGLNPNHSLCVCLSLHIYNLYNPTIT